MPEKDRGTDRAGRRPKRFLTPSQKYEIWVQLVRKEATMAELADRWEVDLSTIMRIRTVAKDSALEALATSKPGRRSQRDAELESARAETERLRAALAEMVVRLTLAEGKGLGAEWPGPTPGGCGHQDSAVGSGRGGRGRS